MQETPYSSGQLTTFLYNRNRALNKHSTPVALFTDIVAYSGEKETLVRLNIAYFNINMLKLFRKYAVDEQQWTEMDKFNR
jgi:hypothetical protein